MIDDLWSLGLASLTEVKTYDRKVVDHVPLVGRNLEPWRAVLAVALWLQERHGVEGIFDRMADLAVRYQSERIEVEEASPVRVAIAALQSMLTASNEEAIECSPTELATVMNKFAQDEEIEHPGETFTTSQKVGALLRRQRVERAPRRATGKRWRISRSALDALARAYGMPPLQPGGPAPIPPAPIPPPPSPAPSPDMQCRPADSAGNADLQVTPSPSSSLGTTVQTVEQECRDADSAGNADLQETPSVSSSLGTAEANTLDWNGMGDNQ